MASTLAANPGTVYDASEGDKFSADTTLEVAAGVCPECNRTFQNLARHMAGQHPDHANHEQPS